ncbi:MAG: transglutaminase-like domain-containing protein [Patulibacter minatonensis]
MSAPVESHIVARRLDRRWSTRTVAATIMGAAAIAVWWPVFGAGVLWAVPMLAWSLLIATRLVAPEGRWEQIALGFSWLPWVPIAALLVGLPAGTILSPGAFGDTARELARGLRAASEGDGGAWPLAAWLMFVGIWWVRGAINAVRPGNGPAAWAFLYFASPFVLAIAFGRSDDAAWHGTALLVGALLWATSGGLRSALPAVALVAVVATLVASVVGTGERHFTYRGEAAANGEVDWNLRFGPDSSPHTGAVYFDIQSDRPALWRTQVLDRWDGRTFQPGIRDPQADLPQPAAVPSTATVTIRRFRDTRAIGAGRITSVSGLPAQRSSLGESMQFAAAPGSGKGYTSVSQVIDASAQELSQVKVTPADPMFADDLQLYPDYSRYSQRLRPSDIDQEAMMDTIPGWSQVREISKSLAAGTTSQLEVVQRVNAYLTDTRRFRYSRTDVPAPGRQPLLNFLVYSHVGYCQHFAGAAALLLRLAGVPTRVAVGFGTGKSTGGNRYEVADSDAHAWIEVYFKGYGWVAFNPTPAAADARIAGGVDPLAEQRNGATRGGASRVIGLVVLGGLALGVLALIIRRLRRRQGPAGALADVLVRIVPGPARPSTTVAAIGPELAKLGPAVSALGRAAQRERFDPSAQPIARPRRAVWMALRSDVGLLRAARLMLLGAPGADGGAGHVQGVGDTAGSAGSTAPPPRPGAAPDAPSVGDRSVGPPR